MFLGLAFLCSFKASKTKFNVTLGAHDIFAFFLVLNEAPTGGASTNGGTVSYFTSWERLQFAVCQDVQRLVPASDIGTLHRGSSTAFPGLQALPAEFKLLSLQRQAEDAVHSEVCQILAFHKALAFGTLGKKQGFQR